MEEKKQMKNKLKNIHIKFRSGEEKDFKCDEVRVNPFFNVEMKPDDANRYPDEEERKKIVRKLKTWKLNEAVGSTDKVLIKSLTHEDNIPIVGIRDNEVSFLVPLSQIEYFSIETISFVDGK